MTSQTQSSQTSHYAHGHQPSVLASHATRTAQNSCAYFLDRIEPGQRVLDLGCGPGSITLDLATLVGPEGPVVGVDFSEEAIATAQQAASERGAQSTRFMVGDLFALDLEPRSFDIVHAHQVLQHLAHPVAALKAMADFVKPGGIIAVRDADYGAMAWYPLMEGIEHWRTIYSASARALGGEPYAGRRLRAWARAAGLDVEVTQSSTWTYATPEATSWWGNSQADRVLASSFADRAAGQGLTPEQIRSIADQWRQWGRHPDAWFFLPHGEIIATPTHA
ncbi:class I SAM-dependent methyltransferase [Luteococcus peritonei]|uniref:Class I SAM-dependent methyltransferase n=1 Tax=Luteococcus peritonei TaxID=88874 RepID=A0ABW4RX07_9ACTN